MPGARASLDDDLSVMKDVRRSREERDEAINRIALAVQNETEAGREKIISAVIGVFGGDDVIANNAAWILVSIGTAAAPATLAALEMPGTAGVHAGQALGYFGETSFKLIYPQIIRKLFSTKSSTRYNAAFALHRGGWVLALSHEKGPAGEIAGALAKLLHDVSPDVRMQAIESLGMLGEYAAPHAESVIEKMADPDIGMRAAAAQTLGRLGRAAAPRAAELFAVSTGTAKILAAIALSEAAPGRGDVVPLLIEGQAHENARIRSLSVSALAAKGPRASDAQKPLIRRLEDPDTETRCTAIYALDQIGAPPPSIVPRLRSLLHDSECDQSALLLLGKIGPAAKDAIPDIAKKMHGTVGSVPCNAAEALVGIGRASIPTLLKLARSKDEYRRAWSAWALARMVGDNSIPVRVFEEAYNDASHEVRFRLLHGLEMAGPKAKRVSRILYGAPPKFRRHAGREAEILARLSGLRFEDLIVPKRSREIELTLSASSAAYRQDEAINLKLSMRNLSTHSIRVLNPLCNWSMEHALDLIILRDPGNIVEVRNHVLTGGMFFDATVDFSTSLDPGKAAEFDCVLQSSTDTSRRGFPRFYSFHYLQEGVMEEKQPTDRLLPGRYRIVAVYHFAKGDEDKTRFWSQELTREYGVPWHGEIYSNEIAFDIR